MKTPIYDFVKNYAVKDSLRLHMPGHKGEGFLGVESLDLTEIPGADCLYSSCGIIEESRKNLTQLYGTQESFYSCEGSSLCIRAMTYLVKLYCQKENGYILAGRNAHSSFISALALCDVDVKWIYPKDIDGYLSCDITPKELDKTLDGLMDKPMAVYVTTPDYLGNTLDVKGLSEVCKKHGVLFIVDNAHGAYLKFLDSSLHPIDLGADMCCDSAHKTLPVLTGGAYLHVSKTAPSFFAEYAKNALSLFASTSPSYLIMASLDKNNAYLDGEYKRELQDFCKEVKDLKIELVSKGYTLVGKEPLKITIDAKEYGYTGEDLSKLLEKKGVVAEFFDRDYVVFMLTPCVKDKGLLRLKQALFDIEKLSSLPKDGIKVVKSKVKTSVRKALESFPQKINIDEAEGRVLCQPNVTCPPAVSIIVCGEVFDKKTIEICKIYGVKDCLVIK